MIYGYARVSSKSQEENTSLDFQTTKIMNYAVATYGEEIAKENMIQEVISGTISPYKRPLFSEIYNNVKAGDILIVTKLDRLARTAKLILELIEYFREKDVVLMFTDLPGFGTGSKNKFSKVMEAMMAAMIEFNKDVLLENMQEGYYKAKKEAEAEGRKFGRPTAHSQKEKEIAWKMKQNGASIRTICDKLQIRERTLYRYLSEFRSKEDGKIMKQDEAKVIAGILPDRPKLNLSDLNNYSEDEIKQLQSVINQWYSNKSSEDKS